MADTAGMVDQADMMDMGSLPLMISKQGNHQREDGNDD